MINLLKISDAAGERGRENGSFPVAERLKPLGFKELINRLMSDGGGALLDFLAGKNLPGITALEK